MPPQTKNLKPLIVYVRIADLDYMEKVAEERGTSLSQLGRQIFHEWCLAQEDYAHS
jgi:hypothetical protein